MTKEEIIEMAKQAGYVGVENGHPALESFAKIIAEKERDRMYKILQEYINAKNITN
jgi:hypothetical protein